MEIAVQSLAHGGEAVGRLPDGRACFVAGALPGERVEIEVTEERPRWARARLVRVLEASPDRVEAPCPLYGPDRCGGCNLQHASPEAQVRLKTEVLREQLQRLGGIADPPVTEPVTLPVEGYRSHARFAVAPDGHLGFRRARSHDIEPVAQCLLLAPAAQTLLSEIDGGWSGVEEVEIHTADASETHTIVADGRVMSRKASVTEIVDDYRFRVSTGSFFQASAAGAETLVRLVREAAAITPGESVLDLYSGVGLYSRFLADEGATVTAIESSQSACDDAEANLRDTGALVICDRVARALPRLTWADVVVLDPPRQGAGAEVCRLIARLEPRTVVYVSCDPATLARDAKVLGEEGYELARAVPVDQFGHTHHIEAVATFTRR